MARRAKVNGDLLSLFPFMSILTCLIGTLTMLIALLSMQQVGKAEADQETFEKNEQERVVAERRLQEFKILKEKTQTDKRSISTLQKAIQSLEEKNKALLLELAQVIKENALRIEEVAKRSKAATQAEVLMGELNRIKEKITKVTASLEEKKKEIAEKTVLLTTKTKKSVSTVTVRPSGSKTGLKPLFVECTKNTLVIYEGDTPKRIPASVLKTDPVFNGVLGTVKANEQMTLVFLIRSEGIWTYHNASAQADLVGARHGKLPLIGDGLLDLSLFGVNRKEASK